MEQLVSHQFQQQRKHSGVDLHGIVRFQSVERLIFQCLLVERFQRLLFQHQQLKRIQSELVQCQQSKLI